MHCKYLPVVPYKALENFSKALYGTTGGTYSVEQSYSTHSFVFKNKTEQNTHNEKYNQTNITVKIHRNHDGVSATAIMLKSIAAGSPWRSPVIAVKQVSEITSE